MRLTPDNSILAFVDVQEKFMPVIEGSESLVREASALACFAGKLGVPVLATEQNPAKLGPTVGPLKRHLDPTKTWGKMAFSCCGSRGFSKAVTDLGRKKAVVCGIETQVCILQTCLDLMESGIEVHLALDALGSRSAFEKEIALRRLESEGARVCTVESVVFQWLEKAGTPEFKEFQAHIKGRPHG